MTAVVAPARLRLRTRYIPSCRIPPSEAIPPLARACRKGDVGSARPTSAAPSQVGRERPTAGWGRRRRRRATATARDSRATTGHGWTYLAAPAFGAVDRLSVGI